MLTLLLYFMIIYFTTVDSEVKCEYTGVITGIGIPGGEATAKVGVEVTVNITVTGIEIEVGAGLGTGAVVEVLDIAENVEEANMMMTGADGVGHMEGISLTSPYTSLSYIIYYVSELYNIITRFWCS